MVQNNLYNNVIGELLSTLIDKYADGKFSSNDIVDSEITQITAENFSGASLGEFAGRNQQIWTGLLELLSDEKPSFLKHYGLRENDFDEQNESVGGYINTHADLSDNYLENYLKENEENEDGHWNESLKLLIDYYKKYIRPESNGEDLIEFDKEGNVLDSHGNIKPGKDSGSQINYRIDDIKNADAGNYFGDNESFSGENYQKSNQKDAPLQPTGATSAEQQSNLWVRPWFNIDGETYSKVRSNDKIKRVLNSKDNLQFTRYKEKETDYQLQKRKIKNYFNESINNPQQTEKYLRLITPMYDRIVEIEDLNRNFWAIGQTLSALCAYLFGDDSPIATMLTGLLDEITQLWENVFYLWAALLESQNKSTPDAQFFFVPVVDSISKAENSESFVIYDENKFDNFAKPLSDKNKRTAEDWLNIARVKLEYLIDQYPNTSMVILPEIRRKNYADNYYAEVIYPGLIVYNVDRNKSRNFIEGQDSRWQLLPFNSMIDIDLTLDSYYNKLTVFDENWENEVVTIDSFENLIKDENKVAIAALRTVPKNITINADKGIINSFNMELEFDDVAMAANNQLNNLTNNVKVIEYNISYNGATVNCTKNNISNYTKLNEFNTYNLHHLPFYRGEVASWVKMKVEKTISKDNLFSEIAGHQLKLGSFMEGEANDFKYLQVTGNHNFTDIRGNINTRNIQTNRGSIATIYYWKNIWENGYNPFKNNSLYDERSFGSSDFQNDNRVSYTPFKSGSPEKHGKAYLTAENLYNDSLKAVKAFIEGRVPEGENVGQFDTTIPHYFITEVGLAPWKGTVENQGYWNFSGISHFIVYLPEPQGDVIYEENSKTYESFEPLINLDSKIKGKIVCCSLVNRYETFPSIAPYGGWRLIQFLGVKSDNNKIETTIYSRRGYVLSSITKIKFSDDFLVQVKYFNGNTDPNYPKNRDRIHAIYSANTNGFQLVNGSVGHGSDYSGDDIDKSKEPLPYKNWIEGLEEINYVGNLGYKDGYSYNTQESGRPTQGLGFSHENNGETIQGLQSYGYNNPGQAYGN